MGFDTGAADTAGRPFADLDGMASKAKEVSAFLKALAHESRLMILCILCTGEKSVTELERTLQLRQPTVSQQLARLRTEGMVSARREGKTIFYSLANENVRVIIDTIYGIFCRPADGASTDTEKS